MRCATLLIFLMICATTVSHGDPDPSRQETAADVGPTIQYLSGATVYVSAGREQGLKEGDVLEVRREGRIVATLKVLFLSSRASACEIVHRDEDPRAGDLVRSLRLEPPAPVPETSSEAPIRPLPRRSRGWFRDNGLRGRIGMRFMMLADGGTAARRVTQRGLDARLDGQDVGGSPIDLSIDIRARRTYKNGSRTDGGRGSTRVYRLSGAWQMQGSTVRLTAGRQSSVALATVGVFDGGLLERLGRRWSFGGFSGSQPDPVSYGASSEIWESGIYCQRANAEGSARRYALTAGLIGSYRRGLVNREFVYLQQRFDQDALGITMAEEIDFNRAWKSAAGERPFSVTSFYAQSRMRIFRAVDLHAGFDNRRNVRLYRDAVTPETDFDDTYRQGTSVGVSMRRGDHLDIAADARFSRAGGSLQNDSYTASFGISQISRLGLGARTRSTRYRSDRLDGWLHSLYLVSSPLGFLYLELRGGLREETAKDPVFGGRLIRWFGGDADFSATRRLYFVLSGERTLEDGQRSDQLFLRASLRY